MPGKRFFTADLTFFCSALVPFWATRAKALRACALSGIGYLRFPGRANDFLPNFFRSLLLRFFLLTRRLLCRSTPLRCGPIAGRYPDAATLNPMIAPPGGPCRPALRSRRAGCVRDDGSLGYARWVTSPGCRRRRGV